MQSAPRKTLGIQNLLIPSLVDKESVNKKVIDMRQNLLKMDPEVQN